MFAHFFAGCLVALAAIPEAAAPAPVPDVVVPGTRSIKVEMHLNAQPLVDHCCVQHVVVKGETLSEIAANHRKHMLTGESGSSDRIQATTVKDIVALNPGLKPDKLAIGQRIWMPPRIPAAAKTENMFVFVDQRWPFGGLGQPFAPSDKTRSPRRGQTAFMLVQASELAAYTKATKSRDWQVIDKIKKATKTLNIAGSGHSVWDESPVHSCKDTITIERNKKGEFSIKLDSVAYDKAGKVVSPAERKKDHRKNKKTRWLLLLPVFGGGFLWWRSRRRTQPQVMLATA